MDESLPSLESDIELEWMAELDWSIHGPKGSRFVADHVPLARVAAQLAELAGGPFWQDEFPYHLADAGKPTRGKWVEAESAFAKDGTPTTEYHAKLCLALAHARSLQIGLRSPTAVAMDEWTAIDEVGGQEWSAGESARRLWSQLAPLLARLAFENRITTYARPIGGGEEVPVEARLWKIDPDIAIIRLSRCGFDPIRPFDRDAQPTHLFFVDRFGLRKTLQDTARQHYLPYFAVAHRMLRPIDEGDPSEGLMTAHLHHLLRENPELTRDECTEALQDRFSCKVRERMMTRLRNNVIAKDPALKQPMTKTGPRRR